MLNAPKHLLLTGASSGLGAALAEEYAGAGVTLSLTGRNADRLQKVAEKAERYGARAVTTPLDVTDAEALKAWILERDAAEPIDLVIANAGISAGTGTGKESEAQSRAIFDINLTGVLNTIHPLIPPMTARRSGQIVIMSSLASFRGFTGAPAYCASKAAVRLYGEALRGDLARYGVRVNVICPGFVKTPMTDVNRFRMPFLMSPERAARIIRKGLEADRARIAFPWQMVLAIRLIDALPACILDRASRYTPRK
jgi:short-subunit dehydrogenase